jgi:hypothetical protein
MKFTITYQDERTEDVEATTYHQDGEFYKFIRLGRQGEPSTVNVLSTRSADIKRIEEVPA